ncbi:MAG: hypothetical protein V3T49_04355 [Dehalococcoidia bacterium]
MPSSLVRLKAIQRPSGDQRGSVSAPEVTAISSTPVGLRRVIPRSSPLTTAYASHWPSGDQSPILASSDRGVRRSELPDATVMTSMLCVPF